MAVNQVVFTGVPAFVGVVKGRTTVEFFIDENEFDPANMIAVDLAKNPDAISESAWATDVECDFQTTGGGTTIGPHFNGGNHVGCVYLADQLTRKYAKVLASWPPKPDDIYQYQLVHRADPRGVMRYHGFKGQVMSAAKGSLAHVSFIRTGSPTPAGGPGWWIDLDDPGVCDPASNGFTKITPSSPVGSIGAVFLSSAAIAAAPPTWPKIPPWLGW